uniref:Uncharacterized protein n=1 Tax=Arundo donax TaxID=35708 RepID=A0A0A9CST6_ARUDO
MCHLVHLHLLQGFHQWYQGRLFQPRRCPTQCSIQPHPMLGRTGKPRLFGIKRLVGTCQWHLHPQDQLLLLIKQQEHHISWQTLVVCQATMGELSHL